VAIVLLAVFKKQSPHITWVIFGMIIAMAATIQLYAKKTAGQRKADRRGAGIDTPSDCADDKIYNLKG